MPYRKLIIDFDKIYESNFNGPFKIIEDLGYDERSRRIVRIQFINTGTVRDVRYDAAMAGKVIDELYGIDFNRIFNSNYYGPYKIISYQGRDYESKKVVRIRFLNTGYEYDTLLRCANSGEVKDSTIDYHDRQFSVMDKEDHNKHIARLLKTRWRSMMSRCYNKNDKEYCMYGELGVTVCESWHNFDNYLQSMPQIINYDKFYNNPAKYHLDKDYFQQNIPKSQRIYSTSTCIFLSIIDNSNLATMDKKDRHAFPYYGIKEVSPGIYEVGFTINRERKCFGRYRSLTAALNEYNYYYTLYGNFEIVPLMNPIAVYIPHEVALTFLVTRKPIANTK